MNKWYNSFLEQPWRDLKMVFVVVVKLLFYDQPDDIRIYPVPPDVATTQAQCDGLIPELREGLEEVRIRRGAKSLEITCTGSVATKG